jgi:hypothetical protein
LEIVPETVSALQTFWKSFRRPFLSSKLFGNRSEDRFCPPNFLEIFPETVSTLQTFRKSFRKLFWIYKITY